MSGANVEQLDLAALFPGVHLDDIEEQRVALFTIEGELPRPSAELRASMTKRGLLQPVLLNAHGDWSSGFRVIDGRRRIAAARELGWTDIRAYVVDLDPLVEASLAITANAIRGDNPVSDTRAIRELALAGYTERDIAQATGLRLAKVRKRLKFARLNDAIFDGVTEGRVAVGVAERAAGLPRHVQDALAGMLAQHGRITGDDVAEAVSVGVTTAVESLGDLFGAIPGPGTSDPRDRMWDSLRDVLRAYAGQVTYDGWIAAAAQTWTREYGERE